MKWSVVALLVVASCVTSGDVICENNKVCPAGYTCSPYGCVSAEQREACVPLAEGDTCVISRGTGVCVGGACIVSVCGNRVVEGLEVCDDGNTFSGDGCDGTCRSDETCGNGIAEADEQCDCGDATHPGAASCNGASNGGIECSATCTRPRCGDGTLDPGEVCDDTNVTSGDGCSGDCASLETCGNGYIDYAAGELCEDGNDLAHDGCIGCGLERPTWKMSTRGVLAERKSYGIAYDAARGRVVLFGGQDDTGFRNDTWEWDGATWRDVTPPTNNPAVRGRMAMAYDAARRRVVMFGGFAGAGAIFSDTWEWNGLGWQNVTPSTASPRKRERSTMAYDAARHKVVLFGGADTPTVLADTWEWDGTTWTERMPTTSPSARTQPGMAYDPSRGRIVLFGGRASGAAQNDTWEWDGTNWSEKTLASGNPPIRFAHAMAYDTKRSRTVIFGGFSSTALDDIWEWNGTTWTNVTPVSGNPAARYELGFAYDTARSRAVIFGGTVSATSDETWEWTGTAWEDKTITSTSLVVPNISNGLAYDSVRGRLVMAGAGNTREWDGQQWLDVTPASSPSARTGAAVAYDAERRVVVMFGGNAGSLTNETWTWDGTSWTNATPASGNPSARTSHGLAYDPVRKKVVMFGGYNGGLLADTWEWNGTTWTNVTPSSGNPIARQSPALAYDAGRGRIVMFGGGGATSAIGSLNEIWEWDGSAWTNRTPTLGPVGRSSALMTYDYALGHIIMFGGTLGGSILTDTWEWNGTEWTDLTRGDNSPDGLSQLGMAYDASRARTTLFVGSPGSAQFETWHFRFERQEVDEERCQFGFDGDGDGKLGCDDPDCFGACSPLCNATFMTCDSSWPRCGDTFCNATESMRACPADCGTAPVVCGDFLCESPETLASCPGDCTP